MRYAVLSDIHGNLPALEAVVADLGRRGVDHVFNLGDSLSGPLLPLDTARFLMRTGWTHLAGNHEEQLLDPDSPLHGAPDAYALAQLTPAELDWVRQLRSTQRFSEDIFLCHGTPRHTAGYFLETVEATGVRLASTDEIVARRGAVAGTLILCGHTHYPRAVRLPGGQLIVNPGSVGLPAYAEDRPHTYVVENGAPDARYAIAERRAGVWQAELIAVPYDHEAMARLAARNGRPDWEIALRSGYARG